MVSIANQPISGTVTANPASGTIDTVTTVTAVTDITNTIDSTISGNTATNNDTVASYVAVATGQTDSAVSGGSPAYLTGIFVTAAGVSDSILIKDGSTTILTLAPNSTEGAIDLGNNGKGIAFTTSIVVTTGANESCVIYYKVT